MAHRDRSRMKPSPLHPISAETAQLDNAEPLAASHQFILLSPDRVIFLSNMQVKLPGLPATPTFAAPIKPSIAAESEKTRLSLFPGFPRSPICTTIVCGRRCLESRVPDAGSHTESAEGWQAGT
jgi:hypothetical protein